MASTYPTTLDTFATNHVNDTNETVSATTINDLASGVNKIEAELGTDPSGSYATLKARLIGVESRWLTYQSVSGFIQDTVAGTQVLVAGSNPLPLNATWSGAEFFHWTNADWAMTGLTTRWSVEVSLLTNGTPPGGTLTFGLLAINASGGASGQNLPTPSTDIGGPAVFTAPTANGRFVNTPTSITAPADGWYAPYITPSLTTATGSREMYNFKLRVRNT